MRKLLFLLLGLSAFIGKSDAQEVGLKTNLLYLASASPNLGVEIGLGQRTTLEISAGFNPFTFSHDRKWKHWLVQPEFKWWTCERFNGHFLGVHMLGGGFDVGNLAFFPFSMWDSLKDNRYKGHAIGAGISYGYDWVLGRHWNLEAEIGMGYAHAWFDRYHYPEHSTKVATGTKEYWGLTKLAVSFGYLF